MKGSSGVFGMPLVSKLCHQMEGLFTKECKREKEDISEKVEVTLNFVNLMRSFLSEEFPPADEEERLKSFIIGLFDYSWTHQPFGSDGLNLKNSLSFVKDKLLALRPSSIENRMLLDQFHQDLIDLRDHLSNHILVLDIERFEKVPLSIIGWAFALNEELPKRNSRLILTGLKPAAVSLITREKILRYFDTREKLSQVILDYILQ